MTKNYLTIFKNEKANTQVTRKDGSLVSYGDKPLMHSDLNGKIKLEEGLPAGEYDIAIYKQVAKSGLNYFSGKIKPAWKPEAAQEAPAPQDKVEEELSEDIPF